MLDPILIAKKTIAHVREFATNFTSQCGRCLIINNLTSTDGPFLYTAGICKDNSSIGAPVFLIVNSNSSVLLAGSYSIEEAMVLNIEAKALILALDIIIDKQ